MASFGELNSVSGHRKADFKKTVDATEGRRRRNDTTLKIRKEKKEKQLKKKRDRISSNQLDALTQMNVDFANAINQQPATKPTMADAPRFVQMLMSPASTGATLVEATQGLRRILSVEKNIPAVELINMGILPHLVRNLSLLTEKSSTSLIFESAWALTNIASTECSRVVAESEAIEPLIRLLGHKEWNIQEQAAWCLGNIAGEGPKSRDMVLNQGGIQALLQSLYRAEMESHVSTVIWTISNLCRGEPSPPLHVTSPVLFPFAKLLDEPITDEARIDLLWALSYLSDGNEDKMSMVTATGVAPKLIRLLENENTTKRCKLPIVRILGNFVSGSHYQTQSVIDSGIFNHLAGLLATNSKMIRKEAAWLTSNIACGNRAQVNMLMDQRKILSKIIKLAKNDAWEVRKEALWALAHIFTHGSESNIMKLVKVGGLEPLVAVLSLQNMETSLLLSILDALGKILEIGTKFPHQNYVELIEEYDGIGDLEDLQTHPNESVYRKVVDLIETYLGTEEEGDENLAPVTNDAGNFGFGLAAPKQLFTNFSANESSGPLPFGSVSTNTFHPV